LDAALVSLTFEAAVDLAAGLAVDFGAALDTGLLRAFEAVGALLGFFSAFELPLLRAGLRSGMVHLLEEGFTS
jgi:hypothetical protein